MSGTIINLIIQLDCRRPRRQCGRRGSLLTSLIPMLQNAAGGADVGAWVGQLVGGGVSGAIVSAIGGLVMNNMKRA